MRTSRYRFKLLAAKILLIGLGLVVAFLTVELSFRVFGLAPQPVSDRFKMRRTSVEMDRALFMEHPRAGRVLRPHAHFTYRHPEFTTAIQTIDPLEVGIGFRDDGIDKNPVTVVLGDSFAMSAEVPLDQAFPELLEEMTGMDFFNAGMFGLDPIREAKLLELIIGKLRPRMVLLIVYTGNDFLSGYRSFPNGDLQRMISPAAIADGLRSWLDLHSVIYNTTKLALRTHTYADLLDRGSFRNGAVDVVFAPRSSKSYAMLLREYPADFLEGVQQAFAALTKIRRLAEEADGRLAVAIAPSREQVYWDTVVRWLTRDPSRYDREKPNRLVLEWCRQTGVHCLDLLPVLEAVAGHEQVYWKFDGHWTAKGHKLVAEAIGRFLERERVIGRVSIRRVTETGR